MKRKKETHLNDLQTLT